MDILRDNKLSWKAKGLYLAIRSIPREYRCYKNIMAISQEGESSVRNGIHELQSKNYLDISKIHQAGKFRYEWTLKGEEYHDL